MPIADWNIFHSSSHEKLEKKLDMLISEVRAGKREGSVVSTRSFATAAENENETWDALRRELEDIGISPEIITEKRHFIVAWFQEAVAAGRLEEEAPSDEDADSIADQNSQSSVGKSHSNSVINRESSSHVLVQETFTRSSCDLNNHDIPLPFTSSRSAIRSQGEAVMKTGLAAESSVESTKAQKLPKLEKRSRLSVSYLLSKLLGKEGQLLEAAIVGDLDRVRALLDEGVEIEARDKVGATALINTATHGHSQIVRLLFDYGANVNATTTGGETALLKAVEHGHSQIVRLLLDHGANVNVTTMWHKTALSTAAEQDETVDIVQMLLDNNAEINEPGTRYPPLIVAARQESMAVLQLLIDRGANVESGDLFCRTALRVAALSGRERAVRLLIENGAAIEAPNSLGNTVLFTAAGSDGLSKVVKLLLEKGANTEAIGDLGFTPLHKAAISDCGDNARLLIEYGAKTDSRDKHGRTPLQLAEQTKKKAVMQVLRRQESLELFRRHK